jgi:hypothetical protein
MTLDVADTLRERAAYARREAAELSRRITRISFARLAATAAIVVAGAGLFSDVQRRGVFALAMGVAIGVFALLVVWNERLSKLRRRAVGRASVSEQGAHRADRDWTHITPQPWTWLPDAEEWLRVDLDVVGSASLVQLLPTMSASVAAPRMRQWLTDIASPEEIRDRQAAVRELIDQLELREAFELHARQARVTEAELERFVNWGRSHGRGEPVSLAVLSRALPVITVGSIILAVLSPAADPPAAAVALLSIALTAVLAAVARSRTGEAVRSAEVGAHVGAAYSELGSLILRARFDSARLKAIESQLGTADGSLSVDRAFSRLSRLARWAEVRSSPMLHGILQALFAWDCQIARAVERWRAMHGAALGAWLTALADVECLAALAGLAHTNPSWTFPDVANTSSLLHVRARELAHPLLRADTRIANDVEIGPSGTLLLISGSNMSGKSTLLRAIGLNLLLARVGAPVCAGAMSCPPMRLMTSLRVQDSLREGMSYFMAEALRLRDIIFAAEAARDGNRAPVLYLVDEILRGTNSEERAVASRFIVARLLQTPAIGIITTHDLGMFDAVELAGHVRHAHFAERFSDHPNGERLVFDYKLREGPTTSTNALRLLALVGLTADATEGSSGRR